jgi:hypothetical protein
MKTVQDATDDYRPDSRNSARSAPSISVKVSSWGMSGLKTNLTVIAAPGCTAGVPLNKAGGSPDPRQN